MLRNNDLSKLIFLRIFYFKDKIFTVIKIEEDEFLINISQQFTFLRIVKFWMSWFTEAMLNYSFLWVTEYFIIALDTSIRVFYHMSFFFHFIKWSWKSIENFSNADALSIFRTALFFVWGFQWNSYIQDFCCLDTIKININNLKYNVASRFFWESD